jgi:DNA-binding SARP family transcriptional activator
MEKIKQKYEVLTVKHDNLNKMEECKRMWEYLLPEEPFDEKRWNLLDELYINKLVDKHSIHVMKKSIYHKYIQYY